MKQIIAGTVIMCAGVALVIFKKKFVEEVIRLNNDEGFGFYKYGNREKKACFEMCLCSVYLS
jgi:hypothetical protein